MRVTPTGFLKQAYMYCITYHVGKRYCEVWILYFHVRARGPKTACIKCQAPRVFNFKSWISCSSPPRAVPDLKKDDRPLVLLCAHLQVQCLSP
ncbi:hypothetical protein FJTKL_00180 [Diaporthe vaccinii]|uniref:Uncharacterized protein n=1 Tax=Diaporthe vaccinii TaxID=105482 RepID=A0ABR4E430_9PEZI